MRITHFVRGLGGGYLATFINIAYTAVSVPLALHYLGKDQFGLWSLAQQIVGYLILLDLGVTSAVSRFIADHKDDVNGGDYGRLLLTGGIVFAIQGVLIAFVGIVFSIFAPFLFAIPMSLARDFTNVLVIITSISGFSIFSRSLAVPLWSFHRIDFSYLMGSLTLLTGFAAMWLGFHLGWGIYSLAFSGLPAAFLCPVMTFYFCKKNGFYPSAKSAWQKPTWSDIQRVFVFGKDAALMSLGSQMVNASQIMIISRFVGLDAAATFSVGTKLYSLGQQLVAKIVGAAAPSLTELFVRGELSKFNARFLDVLRVSAFASTLIASFLVAGNSGLVSFWTSGVVNWKQSSDAILGALLIATSLTRCMTELFVFRGSLRSVRHIYLLEGVLAILFGVPVVATFGVVGLLASSLCIHLAVTVILSVRASERLLPSIKPIIFSGIASLLVFSLILGLSLLPIPSTARLIPILLKIAVLVLMAAAGGWYFIFPQTFRKFAVCSFRNI
jgi:O-antigen/teichoic acid export membrane protein